MRIYAVDDDENYRAMLRAMLREEKIKTVSGPRGIIDLFATSGPPDLLITDGSMPTRGDGIRLIEDLRRNLYNGPVVHWSGDALTEAERARLFELKAVVLTKPCKYQDFLEAVKEACNVACA